MYRLIGPPLFVSPIHFDKRCYVFGISIVIDTPNISNQFVYYFLDTFNCP